MFDCSNIGDFYDCGCAEDDEKHPKKIGDGKGNELMEDIGAKSADRMARPNGEDLDEDILKGKGALSKGEQTEG